MKWGEVVALLVGSAIVTAWLVIMLHFITKYW